jgi:hypothetical protein
MNQDVQSRIIRHAIGGVGEGLTQVEGLEGEAKVFHLLVMGLMSFVIGHLLMEMSV